MPLLTTLKDNFGMITGSISLVTAIGGAIIYVETNYAHAGDVKEIIQQQSTQIKLYERNQRQQGLFQLEYYDDRLRRLQQERDMAAAQPKGQRRVEDIQSDINDIKQRREMVRKSIEGQ